MERTPQCRLYRSLRCLLATATTARRIEQSINCIDSNHVGMLLSSPTSNSLSGRVKGFVTQHVQGEPGGEASQGEEQHRYNKGPNDRLRMDCKLHDVPLNQIPHAMLP